MAVGIATPARAQSDARINAIQSQAQALNAELQRVKRSWPPATPPCGRRSTTISQTSAPKPLPEVYALAGLVGHPSSVADLYSYVSTEQVGRRSFNIGDVAYGYGNPTRS